MTGKTWEQIYARLDALDFGEVDMVVAIAAGGIIPAGLIQQKLKLPMKIIALSYRDETHAPKYEDAQVLETEPNTIQGKKILLVDDVSRSGKTLRKAAEYLRGNSIKTCVVNGPSDYSFFNEIECFEMPWKR